jgi:hypothetical protein
MVTGLYSARQQQQQSGGFIVFSITLATVGWLQSRDYGRYKETKKSKRERERKSQKYKYSP